MNGGKLVIDTELGTKNFDKQYAKLKNQLEEIETILSDKTIDYEFRLKNEAEAEKIKNQMTEIELRAKRAGETTDKAFKNAGNTLKKFGLRLFGIGTTFAFVSRASSAYLSQNEEVANKLKGIWTFLGELVGPVIDFIADGLLKLIGYINVFIKALTGIDLVARANAKALNKQAQAQHNLNKETQQYDFDVIRTQTSTSSDSGVSNGSASGLIEIPELNQGIVEKLQSLAKWLKENYKWLLAIVGIIGGIKIAKWLAGLAGIIGGAGKGLMGISFLLKGLLAIGVIAIGIKLFYSMLTGRDIVKDLEEIRETFKKNEEAEKKLTKSAQEHTKELKNNVEAGKLNQEQIDRLAKSYSETNKTIINQIENLKESNTIFHSTKGEIEEVSKQMDIYVDAMGSLYKQGLLNEEQTKTYYNMLFEQIQIMEELGKDTDELRRKYELLTGETYEITFEARIKDNVTEVLERMKKVLPIPAIDKMIAIIRNNGSYGGGSGGGTRGYALGGIVTQPTRAIIGEAGYNEYIVPEREDYLSRLATMIGKYNGGGVTNVYLDGRLIQRQVSRKQNQVDFSTNS